MTAQIKRGQWVRWLNPDAPLGQWRKLDAIFEAGWPRWQVTLVFEDGYVTPWHRDNLAVVDEHGTPLWEVSDTEPEEAVRWT